jgi:hypothetical protein
MVRNCFQLWPNGDMVSCDCMIADGLRAKGVGLLGCNYYTSMNRLDPVY